MSRSSLPGEGGDDAPSAPQTFAHAEESEASIHELDEWADAHPADPEIEGTEGLR